MKYAENLEGIFNLHAQNMAITEKMAEYTFGTVSNERTLEELIEDITFDLTQISNYISGDEPSSAVDDEPSSAVDDVEAARFMLGALVSLTQFMVETTDPAILRELLHKRVISNAKDFIKMASHDGIDTIEDGENIAYTYKVLGERCAYNMAQYLNRTPSVYFDTDTICEGNDKHMHRYIVMMGRGCGKKRYADMASALFNIKNALRSDKCMENILADISAIISTLDGIDTTEGGEK